MFLQLHTPCMDFLPWNFFVSFPTRIIWKGIWGFVTGYPCDLWYVVPLYVAKIFGKAILNHFVCKFDLGKNGFYLLHV